MLRRVSEGSVNRTDRRIERSGIMANVYGRVAKISNAVGRSSYINDKERQEEIVLHKENMQYSWQEHSSFEKEHKKTNVANNEALEVHVALPNALAQDKEKLESVCDDLAKDIVGFNKDYEYSVHWNHNRTNLHVHILFSERENQLELEPKIYKRDIYYNFKEKKLSKKSDSNAEIIHHKGEVQRDKEGNIKYQTDVFKPKDKQYISRNWVQSVRDITQKVLKAHGYELDLTTKDSPYLPQKKLYKGAREDYLEKAREWNKEVKRYNEGVKQHIELEPAQLENYRIVKKELLENVKEANAEEKKITPRAIELIQEMANWVHQTLMQLKVFTKRKARELKTMEVWEKVKDQFSDLFENSKKLEGEVKELNQQIDILDKGNKEFTEVIQSKKELVKDMENYESQRSKLYEEIKKLEPRAYRGYSKEEYFKEIQGLTYEERIEKAKDIIKQQRIERSRGYDFER